MQYTKDEGTEEGGLNRNIYIYMDAGEKGFCV